MTEVIAVMSSFGVLALAGGRKEMNWLILACYNTPTTPIRYV